MKRAAIISAILDDPEKAQRQFNDVVSNYSEIIRGRMGIPFGDKKVALISLMVVAELDVINTFTGKLGRLNGTTVKVFIANEDVTVE